MDKAGKETKKKYPLRNEPLMLLYTDYVRSFFAESEKRIFVRNLIKSFSSSVGYSLSPWTELEWKYSFECLYNLLKRVKANPLSGVSIYLIKNIDGYFITVVLASKDENNYSSLCVIAMIPWSDFRFSIKKGIVEYKNDSGIFVESIHPSALIVSMLEHLSFGRLDTEEYIIKPCVYFFDAGRSISNDLTPKPEDEKEIIHSAQVFYADETKELCSYIGPSVTGFDGRKILEFVSSLGLASKNNNGASIEKRYYDYQTLSCCAKKIPFLMILTGRFICFENKVIKYYRNYDTEFGIHSAIVHSEKDLSETGDDIKFIMYVNYVPEIIDFTRVPYNVVLVDPLIISEEKFNYLTKLKDDAEKFGADYHRNEFYTVSGFSDDGGGNNWLIRHFNLGIIEYQRWFSKLYSIDIIGDVSEFRHEKGIADVIVPDSFRYNPETDMVDASPEDKRKMYRDISFGERGVCLYIANPELKQYISQKLEDSKNRYSWIDRLIKEYGGNVDKIVEAQSKQLNNSTVQAKYQKFVVAHIGKSSWDKLSPDSKDWVISALLTYNDLKEYSADMDFSGVTLMISKVFEFELKRRIAVGFVNYLKKKYGRGYTEYLPLTLMTGPRDGKMPKNPDSTTMGDIPFIMGFDPEGRLYDRKRFAIFSEFAEKELLADCSNIRQTCKEIVQIENHIRKTYRNTSAHSVSVDVVLATECISDSISGKGMLGTLMSKFRY